MQNALIVNHNTCNETSNSVAATLATRHRTLVEGETSWKRVINPYLKGSVHLPLQKDKVFISLTLMGTQPLLSFSATGGNCTN